MNPNVDFAFETEAQNDWGNCAAEYARLSAEIGFYSAITDRLVSLIDPHVDSVVDFGCGDGRFTKALLGRARSVGRAPTRIYLVDKFVEMLALASAMEHPGTEFIRVCDDECLSRFPPEEEGQVDAIACNSSLFLCRGIEAFLKRSAVILKRFGRVVANIPDQHYLFTDGWRSQFGQRADEISPFRNRSPDPWFSDDFLRELARDLGFEVEIEQMTCSVSWKDFVSFYSVPFMGARLMPNMAQDERVRFLREYPPAFAEIPWRWMFFVMTKRD